MANREALRELQARLASRLQAARTEGVQASWLAVESGGSKFLIPLGQSGEIFPFTAAMPVPYTQTWFHGVAGLRNMDAFSSSSPPPEGAPDYFGSGYTDASGAYWQELNLQALSQQPQF